MHYEGNVIRPPSEADAIILQVTTGCSHNKCTFCGAYKDKLFTLKDWSIIDQDIQFDHICFAIIDDIIVKRTVSLSNGL